LFAAFLARNRVLRFNFPMQKEFKIIYRGFLFLFCGLLLWSVWRASAQEASSQSSTSKVEVSASVTATESKAAEGDSTAAQKKGMATPQWVEKLAVNFPFLKQMWWGNELWKYIFSFIYIFLAFYVSKLLDYLTRVWLKKWAAKTETKFDDLLLEVLNGPVKVVAFMLFLRVGLDVFEWPAIVETVLSKGFTIIVAISLTYLVLKMIDLILGYWKQRALAQDQQAFNQQLFPVIRKSLKAFIVVVAAMLTLDNMGVNITAAIASLSIGGLERVGLLDQIINAHVLLLRALRPCGNDAHGNTKQ
jgi:MscS family membrane protein